MLRPGSWSRPAGGSPVRVGTGVPGSRPRFVVERRRAERGVESLFGGSKRAGRSVKRTLQPRQTHNGGAEPLMSRRRPCPAGPVPGSACRVLPGYGGRHARTVWAGTGETRLPGLRRAKTRLYKPMVKSPGGQRESEGVVVPLIGVQHNAPGGKGPHFDHVSGEGKRQGMAGSARSNYPGGREPAVAGRVPPPVPGMGRASPVNVRELQRKLWAAAKQSAGAAFPRPV